MSTDENKAVVRRFLDAYNKRDTQGLKDAATTDLARQFIEVAIPKNSATWADERYEITEIVAEGDKVWARITSSGRQIGEAYGLPPTGKTFSGPSILFLRVVVGKVSEVAGLGDVLWQVRQLGGKIVPAT